MLMGCIKNCSIVKLYNKVLIIHDVGSFQVSLVWELIYLSIPMNYLAVITIDIVFSLLFVIEIDNSCPS